MTERESVVSVRMKTGITGYRDGQPWPAVGETIELPEAEAAGLVANGYAVLASDPDTDAAQVEALAAEAEADRLDAEHKAKHGPEEGDADGADADHRDDEAANDGDATADPDDGGDTGDGSTVDGNTTKPVAKSPRKPRAKS